MLYLNLQSNVSDPQDIDYKHAANHLLPSTHKKKNFFHRVTKTYAYVTLATIGSYNDMQSNCNFNKIRQITFLLCKQSNIGRNREFQSIPQPYSYSRSTIIKFSNLYKKQIVNQQVQGSHLSIAKHGQQIQCKKEVESIFFLKVLGITTKNKVHDSNLKIFEKIGKSKILKINKLFIKSVNCNQKKIANKSFFLTGFLMNFEIIQLKGKLLYNQNKIDYIDLFIVFILFFLTFIFEPNLISVIFMFTPLHFFSLYQISFCFQMYQIRNSLQQQLRLKSLTFNQFLYLSVLFLTQVEREQIAQNKCFLSDNCLCNNQILC